MTDRPPTVALVYVTLKSVQSSHFVLSSTVPTADGGMPRTDGSEVDGSVKPLPVSIPCCVEGPFELPMLPVLPVPPLDLGLMTSTPTGTSTTTKMTIRKMMAHRIIFFVDIRRCAGGPISESCRKGFSGGGRLAVFSVGSTKGFSAGLRVSSLG